MASVPWSSSRTGCSTRVFSWCSAPPSGDIVHVAIDAASLRELDVWPWPRTFHASLVDRLVAAGAAEIIFDVDFSSRSNEQDDAALAAAFRRADGRVVLPAFKQPSDPESTADPLVYTAPLALFRPHVGIAAFNVEADADAVVRRMDWVQTWAGITLPTLAGRTAGVDRPGAPPFLIDYGIRVGTVPRLSYARVLAGEFVATAVAGRRIIVGATAVELGDFMPVPGGVILPGVLVQILGMESALQGRALRRASPLLVVLSVLLVQALIGARLMRWSWRAGLLGVAGVAVVAPGAALAAQAVWPVLIDVAPVLTATALSYIAGLIGRIDDQQLRIVAQSFALRRHNAFMRRVVDNTFDGLITVDAQGRIQSFNPAAERMFGLRRVEAEGRALSHLLTDVGDRGLPTYLAGFLAAVVEMRAPVELTGRRADGQAFAIDLAVSHMREGDADVYVAVVRDISARKQAEALAAQTRQRLQDAIESVSEAFVLYDPDDRLVLSNTKFAETHGGGVAAGTDFREIAQSFARLAQGGDDPRWLEERLARHRARSGPFDVRLRDGRWFSVNERPTSDGGVVGTMTEITLAKQREHELAAAHAQAELANRTKSDFMAIMSHELRTPLNAVLGFTEIMKAEQLGPVGNSKYLEYLGDIHGSAAHLLKVINDMLEVTHIQSGEVELCEDEVDPADVVESCMRFVADRAKAAGVSVSVAMATERPVLEADPRLVKQCLLSLLSNAIKFTEAGGHATVRTELAPDGTFAIAVSDTGIGIAAADLDRVTEPFAQVDTSLARKYEGLGLGLPLAKSAMEQHGGALDLVSTPGHGTTATMRFPAARVYVFDTAVGSVA